MVTMSLLAEASENQLVMAAWAFPLISAALFTFSAFVAWSYRDVSNRHAAKPDPEHDDEHAAHH